MIHLQEINKKYGKVKALNDLNVSFKKGQSIALIGPNGAGKTTLIKSILGMVRPDSGEVVFDGQAVENNWEYRQYIGYMPQIGRYPDNMKVRELFSLMEKVRKNGGSLGKDDELYQKFGIADIRDRSLNALSGGMRQKVSASLAFYFNAPVLILDEPTAGLDPVSREKLKEKIRTERGKEKVILVTSHILSDMDEIASHVLYMMEGEKVFFKSIEEIREMTTQEQLSKAILAIIDEKEQR